MQLGNFCLRAAHTCGLSLLGGAVLLAMAGCWGQTEPAAGEAQAVDAAWAALEPHTRSHDRANWQVVELRQVTGQEVAGQFAGEPPPCVYPTPPANQAIDPASSYWYVEWRPRPATPRPQPGTPSPTAPPLVPEPVIPRARFLVDSGSGRVVARSLDCVIY